MLTTEVDVGLIERAGNCATMTWDNIDTEKGLLVDQKRKTEKPVVVPLHRRLLSHLHHVAQSPASGPLCPSVAANRLGGKHGLSESFKHIVVRAGLEPMAVQGKGPRQFSKRFFHSLRHWFTSALTAERVCAEIQMTLTGDADLRLIGNALAAMRHPTNSPLAYRKACVGSFGPYNGVSVELRVVGD